MLRQIATPLFVGFIVWLFARDLRRRPEVSQASWLVLVWVVIFAARPVSSWLSSGPAMSPDAYLEGNPLERSISLLLMGAAALILLRRGLPLSGLITRNTWLFAFFGYCLLSVVWSEYPFVAFKRFSKDFGNVIIVLVLLTEKAPVEAIKATFVRCAYLLVPLSVLFIRYIPELGRVYTGWNGADRMFVGVATHKNTLGALLMVSSAFLVWDMVSRRDETGNKRLKFGWMDQAVVLGMAIWLLAITDSATSLFCTVLIGALFFVTGTSMFKKRLRRIEVYGLVLGGLWFALDSVFRLTELVVRSLGRDMTFTTRTDAWEIVLAMQDRPFIGAGFKSFWSGDRMVRLWEQLPGIVQAHSGYVELYLNGGMVGLAFLTFMLLSGFRKIKRQLMDGDDYSRVRLGFWVIALVYNFSEASFNQLSLLWIVTLLVIAEGPAVARVAMPMPMPLVPTARPILSPYAPRRAYQQLQGRVPTPVDRRPSGDISQPHG